MKVLRGLYVAGMYILAIPFTMMFVVVMLLMNITHPINTLKAMVEGFELGHSQNVRFIKHGRKVV